MSSFSSSCSFDMINTGHSGHINSNGHNGQHQNSHRVDVPPSATSLRRWFPIPCNECRQPIDATAFVCSCDCLFCEDCTYNHFQSNPNCPRCGRILGENDFTEVTVSDPDSKISNDPNKILQSLLTKTSNSPRMTITLNDVGVALLREHQILERNTRFFVTQFVREAERNKAEGQNAVAQVQVYKKKFAKYKNDIIDLQRQQEENKEQLRQKEKQLVEKENQIQHLKRILAHKNINIIRNGGRLISSSDSPRSSLSLSVTHESNHRGFQTYVRKKEERELAEEYDLMNINRNKNIMFGQQR